VAAAPTKGTLLTVKGGVKLGSKGGASQAVAERSKELSEAVGGIPLPPVKGRQKEKNTAVDMSVISDSEGGSLIKESKKVRRKCPADVQLERPTRGAVSTWDEDSRRFTLRRSMSGHETLSAMETDHPPWGSPPDPTREHRDSHSVEYDCAYGGHRSAQFAYGKGTGRCGIPR